jgi:hypothetical protein
MGCHLKEGAADQASHSFDFGYPHPHPAHHPAVAFFFSLPVGKKQLS